MLCLVAALPQLGCGDDDDDLEDIIDDRLDALDIDDDLVITRAEWHEGFYLFDDDGDFVLFFDEFPFSGFLFDLADLNADGIVTLTEWDDVLDAIDTDNDGVIEETELEAYF